MEVTSTYSIKDLERLSGIKAHTLRIWEQRYGILEPARTDTNIRTYRDTDLKRILNISLLNNHGYKISHIAKMPEQELYEEVNKLLQRSQTESIQIESLVLSLLNMDEAKFEQTINASIQNFSFENTIENIIFPFLRQLGNMWQVGLISPAQEHYISNLIRQKLIVGIDGITTPTNPAAKSFLFFLPDNELHELGLIYAHYLAKSRGHRCLYLGQSLPLADLLSIAHSVKPDVLVTIFTAQLEQKKLEELLEAVLRELPGKQFFVSGRLLFSSPELRQVFEENKAYLFSDFSQFKSML